MAYETLYSKAEEWNQSVLEQWNGEENENESIKRKIGKKDKKLIKETEMGKGIEQWETKKEKERRNRTTSILNYSITLRSINTKDPLVLIKVFECHHICRCLLLVCDTHRCQ
jgi:hypothetical protein